MGLFLFEAIVYGLTYVSIWDPEPYRGLLHPGEQYLILAEYCLLEST